MDLPSIFLSGLTPDVISDIVAVLAAAHEGDRGIWILELLRGLMRVKRWDMIVGFLDDQEKNGKPSPRQHLLLKTYAETQSFTDHF